MESADGGWTLIASIHENNIKHKCREGDKWSSESLHSDSGSHCFPAIAHISGKNSISEGYSIATFYSGYRNWENLLTFGDINEATSADFKSPAYSDVPVR